MESLIHNKRLMGGVGLMELTQDRLKELFQYDPVTGLFCRLKSRGRAKAGDISGSPQAMGYLVIKIDRINYYAHRLAFLYMNGGFPEDQVDHINHKTDDNRWINLRPVTRAENSHNRKLNSNSTSGVSGVVRDHKSGRWAVRFVIDGKKRHFGCFDTVEEALPVLREARRVGGYHVNHGI